MQLKVSPISRQECSAAEWQARVDLAAAHRCAVMHGFHEGIFNHLTLTVPGKPDRYYQIPFGTHWSEVTASCFMEVALDTGSILRGEGEVECSCFAIIARQDHRVRLFVFRDGLIDLRDLRCHLLPAYHFGE